MVVIRRRRVKISRGRKHAAIDVEFAAVVVAGDVCGRVEVVRGRVDAANNRHDALRRVVDRSIRIKIQRGRTGAAGHVVHARAAVDI